MQVLNLEAEQDSILTLTKLAMPHKVIPSHTAAAKGASWIRNQLEQLTKGICFV
jgi:hypothetical protein